MVFDQSFPSCLFTQILSCSFFVLRYCMLLSPALLSASLSLPQPACPVSSLSWILLLISLLSCVSNQAPLFHSLPAGFFCHLSLRYLQVLCFLLGGNFNTIHTPSSRLHFGPVSHQLLVKSRNLLSALTARRPINQRQKCYSAKC